MKITLFLTLRAVVEHGTFASAATVLSLTPSAVSMQMKQLESYFGRPLFDRSGSHPRPTSFAVDVLNTIDGALTSIESMRRDHSRVVEGKLQLGVIESLQPVVLPGAIRWLRKNHPRLTLNLTRGSTSSLIAAVKAGEVDMALVAQPEKLSMTTLMWTPVLRRELVLIAPPGVSTLSLTDLFHQYDWIRYDRNTTSGSMAARFVQEKIPDFRVGMELGSLPAMVAMVSAGLGVSVLVLPDTSILARYPIQVISLGAAAPDLLFSLVSDKRHADDLAWKAVSQAVVACVREQESVGAGVGER